MVYIDSICYVFINGLVDTFKLAKQLQATTIVSTAGAPTTKQEFFHANPKLLLDQAHSSSFEPKFSSLGRLGIPLSTFQGLTEGKVSSLKKFIQAV